MSKKSLDKAADGNIAEDIYNGGSVFSEKANPPLVYSKRQFLSSEKYKKYRDLLSVLLEDNSFYGKLEVNKLIDDYLKRSVK